MLCFFSQKQILWRLQKLLQRTLRRFPNLQQLSLNNVMMKGRVDVFMILVLTFAGNGTATATFRQDNTNYTFIIPMLIYDIPIAMTERVGWRQLIKRIRDIST